MVKYSAEEPWPASIIVCSVILGYGTMIFYPINDNLHILFGLALISSIYSRLYPPFSPDRQLGERSEHDNAVTENETTVDPLYPSPILWKGLLIFCEVALSYVLYRDTFAVIIRTKVLPEIYVQAFVATVTQLITLAYIGATVRKLFI